MVKDEHSSKTISFWIKPSDIRSTQTLFAAGNPAIGANVYLEDGHIYAGAWNLEGDDPWDGTWLQSDPIAEDQWTQVSFSMKVDEKADVMQMSLHVSGKLAGVATGKPLESHFTPPRFGTFVTNRSRILMTRFHDGMRKDDVVDRFRGRVDDFVLESSVDR